MTRRGLLGAALLSLAACAGGAARETAEERYPPIGWFVEVDGLRVHYVDRGEGTPVVLIHGASGNLRDFTFSLTDELAARGMRVIAFDRPGLGYTQRPAERGWDPAVQARILRAAARKIGVERAVVAGHSWGGAVALAWALQAPDSVIGVLSIAGAAYPWKGGVGTFYALSAKDGVSRVMRAIADGLIDESDPTAVVARVFEPDRPPAGYADYVGVGLALRPDTFKYNAQDLDRLSPLLVGQAERYAELDMPVEAVHGLADTTVGASIHSEPLIDAVPDGRLTLAPGVGHMVHHAAEDQVIAAIERLVSRAPELDSERPQP